LDIKYTTSKSFRINLHDIFKAKGRGLFARKSFKEGEAIWQETPLVSISYGKKVIDT
jgi:hypothetical protein